MKPEKYSPKKVLFLAGLVVLAIIISNFVLYNLHNPKQSKEYGMHLIVGDRIGFDLNRETLTFGMVTPSGVAVRHIDIVNNNQASKVIITASGELAKWIIVSDNDFILKPNESKTIDISVLVPADAEFGNYTGSFKTKFLKIKNA